MPPFAQVYQRFALAMHDRVTRDTAENVRRIVDELTPGSTVTTYLRVHAEHVAAERRLGQALQDFVQMHRMGLLDDMDIDESDTDDTATSYSQ